MALDTTINDKASGTAANVKPASTAAVAADASLVVAPSPNSVGPVVVTTATQLAAGIVAQNFPAGYLLVSDIARQLFVDDFDSLDVVNRWTSANAGGGVAPAVANSMLTLGTGTTANGYSYLVSQPSFADNEPGWIRHAFLTQTEVGQGIANAYRFWGGGTPQATPTAALPIVNGAGFELFTDGKLYAVVYNAGVRTVVQDFSAATGNNKQPIDGGVHDFAVFYRTAIIYWTIDFNDAPAAKSTFAQLPGVGSLPSLYLAIAGSTPPASSGVITSNVMDVSDNAKHHTTIADATFKWRQAKVTAAGALSIENDSPDTAPGTLGVAPPAATGSVLSAANANLFTGTPTVNSSIQLTLAGDSSAAMTVSAISAPVGFILFPQVSTDGGVTWVNSFFYEPTNGNIFQSLVNAQIVVGASFVIHTPGANSHIRVTVKALTSGTCTVTLRGSDTHPQIIMHRNHASTTYTAAYVLAAYSTGWALSKTPTGGTEFQLASIFHAATAQKQVRLKKVELQIVSVATAAALVSARLVALTSATTPATGNPTITPAAHRPGATAAEATCLALPTTAGTVGAVVNVVEELIGITAGSTGAPGSDIISLWSDSDGQSIEPLIMRALTAEGYAVQITQSTANVLRVIARITFTEE